jgi:DnaJ-class molecular chaperone
MSEFYRMLGVSRKAGMAEIKSAFRTLAKACHPDLHLGDKRAELSFKEIGLAYKTLVNPNTRAKYDAEIAERRAKVRRHYRSMAATMSTSFVLTLSSGLLLGLWLLGDGRF